LSALFRFGRSFCPQTLGSLRLLGETQLTLLLGLQVKTRLFNCPHFGERLRCGCQFRNRLSNLLACRNALLQRLS
jgi:hypothetical protein